MIVWRAITGHFERLRRLNRWPFFWWVTLEGLVLPQFIMQLIGLIWPWPPLVSLRDQDIPRYLFLALVAMPLFELVLWQWLPVMIARRCGARFWTQVFISWLIFFLPHLGNGLRGAIGGGLLAGFYTVFTYVTWRDRDTLWTACWMAWSRHVLHNAIVLAVWWLLVPGIM